jgi:hypothetical protein
MVKAGYHQKSTQCNNGQWNRDVLPEAEQKFSGPTLIGTPIAEGHGGLAHLRIEMCITSHSSVHMLFFSPADLLGSSRYYCHTETR